jgi:hypothetical protein
MSLLDQPGLTIALGNRDRDGSEADRLRAAVLMMAELIRTSRDTIRAGCPEFAEAKMSEFLQAFDFRIAQKPAGSREH